jgi:hypothetical protein
MMLVFVGLGGDVAQVQLSIMGKNSIVFSGKHLSRAAHLLRNDGQEGDELR